VIFAVPLRIGSFAHGSSQRWSLILFCEFISRKIALTFFVPTVPHGHLNKIFFQNHLKLYAFVESKMLIMNITIRAH